MPRFDMPVNTNDQSIDRVLNSGLPVALVITDENDTNASLAETLRQVAKDDAGRLLVARLNARENPQTAARARGARPALITYRDGEEVTHAANITSQSFREHVAFLLGRGPRPAEPTAPPRSAGRQAGPAASGAPVKPVVVSDGNFYQEVLNSPLPVLVDLWAPWCGPCRMVAPVVERIASEYAGRLKVAKLNVDDNPQTAGMYGVQSIPTLLVFRGGQVVDRIVGAAPEPMLRGRVDTALRVN